MSPKTKTVLVVDDDEGMRDTLTAILKREYHILTAATGEEGLAILKRKDVDLVLLDVRLPGISGLELLTIVKENYSLVEVIMVSALSEVEVAVRAMKQGAYHYITKEFDYDGLRSLVRNALERQDLSRQLITLNAQVAEQGDRKFVLGPSKAMREIIDLAQKVARLPATVLIQGESGTGKELLARLLHRESGLEGGPFIAVNLAAIPRDLVESNLFGHERGAFTGAMRQQLGKFELAAGGTLFLDEIADLGLDLQAKLLRAIQEGEIERVGGTKPIKTEFRLVVATNVDLDRAVKEGKFRDDLYYRINVIPFKMPPLRERVEDIPEFVELFLDRYNVRFRKQIRGISDSALKILMDQRWPGNIRELENLIERLVALTDKTTLTDEDLPFEYHLARLDRRPESTAELLQAACDTFERNFLRALERQEWNVSAAARSSGKSGTCRPQRAIWASRSARSSTRWAGSRSGSTPNGSGGPDLSEKFAKHSQAGHPAWRRWALTQRGHKSSICSLVAPGQPGRAQGICFAYFSDRTLGHGVLASANISTWRPRYWPLRGVTRNCCDRATVRQSTPPSQECTPSLSPRPQAAPTRSLVSAPGGGNSICTIPAAVRFARAADATAVRPVKRSPHRERYWCVKGSR